MKRTIHFLANVRNRSGACKLGLAIACIALGLVSRARSQTADSFNPGANAAVGALAVQSDGKILVGGNFTTLAGLSRNYIGRLDNDGSLDTSFNPGANSYVYCLAMQTDGKIVVGGAFDVLGGQPRNGLGRLNADGSLDATFNPGASNGVLSLVVQSDGKILVGGFFTTLAGQPRSRIARLNADGSLDTVFNPGVIGTGSVTTMAVQSDGRILVGGVFTNLAGQPRRSLARLNGDGSLDDLFNPGVNFGVSALAVQPDGKILVGGTFASLATQSRRNIGRLNADGTLDVAFDPGANNEVRSLVVQTDGKIIVGGLFTTLGGVSRFSIGRLNVNGGLDSTFRPAVNNVVYSLAIQANGGVLAGGDFTTLGGSPRNRLGRLSNTEPANESLTFDSSSITWLRGGTSPEVWRTSFEASSNAAGWVNISAGERVSGGWRATGVSLPTGATFRARGFVSGGNYDGSGWFVEAIAGSPLIIAQPVGATNNAGTAAVLSVKAIGSAPLNYQWRKDGVDLSDGGNVSGANTSSIKLASILGGGAGDYSLVVSNSYGSVTSLVAKVVVVDPIIIGHPTSWSAHAGQTVVFSAVAAGTEPFGWRWSKGASSLNDGGNISGARSSSLTLSNVLGIDAGDYSVVLSNSYGMLTSKVARLVVADPFITAQPVSQSLRVGEDVTMNIAAVGTEPLSYQWRKNGTNLLGSAAVSLTLTNVQGTDAGEYQVIVSNLFGQVTSSTVLLSVNLATPDAFDPGPSSAVYGMAMLPDSTVLVGGNFITIGIQRRDYLARLNVDGSLHTTFDSGANSWVNSFSIQSNGRTLVTGAFTSLGGQSSKGFSRLNADGSFDPTFNPELNNGVRPVSEQADGRILVGGDFMSAGPQQRRFIGRLNADGSLDASFNSDANNSVTCLVDQGDGKVLLGGWFTALGGQTHRYIGRLNSDGSPDGSFTADANGAVRSLAVQADGRIILGGEFTMLTGEPRPHLGRLNADGSLDGTFNPGADSLVWALSLQTDGKILVAGAFTTLGDQLRRCIGRLDVDGSLDATFAPRIDRNDLVRCLAVQADGKILVGGDFRTLDGQARIDIGRLNNTGPAIENLAFDGWTLTWRRSGTSPEVWRTSFEISTNGTDWASLGTGQRIPGGWQLAGVRMPTNATIRARGFVSGGGISSWFVETTAGPFAFTNRPALSIARNGSLPFLSISGDVGSLYALEFVPALTPINAWQPLTLLSLTNSPQTYLDPSASGVTQRFYRARLNQ